MYMNDEASTCIVETTFVIVFEDEFYNIIVLVCLSCSPLTEAHESSHSISLVELQELVSLS